MKGKNDVDRQLVNTPMCVLRMHNLNSSWQARTLDYTKGSEQMRLWVNTIHTMTNIPSLHTWWSVFDNHDHMSLNTRWWKIDITQNSNLWDALWILFISYNWTGFYAPLAMWRRTTGLYAASGSVWWSTILDCWALAGPCTNCLARCASWHLVWCLCTRPFSSSSRCRTYGNTAERTIMTQLWHFIPSCVTTRQCSEWILAKYVRDCAKVAIIHVLNES